MSHVLHESLLVLLLALVQLDLDIDKVVVGRSNPVDQLVQFVDMLVGQLNDLERIDNQLVVHDTFTIVFSNETLRSMRLWKEQTVNSFVSAVVVKFN